LRQRKETSNWFHVSASVCVMPGHSRPEGRRRFR